MRKYLSLLATLALTSSMLCAQTPAEPSATAKPAETAAAPAAAAKPANPDAAKYDMGLVQLILMQPGPNWNSPERMKVLGEHKAFFEAQLGNGKVMLGGPLVDGGPPLGVGIFNGTKEEAEAWLVNDPAVKAGVFKPELLKWYTARAYFKKPPQPIRNKRYFFGFLKKGDSWTPAVTDETKKIQAGHMANISRLADMGKLAIAGPMSDAGDMRGIFVFSTDTIEEARELAATDPAIQAGRLKIELHPWMVAAGVLPPHN